MHASQIDWSAVAASDLPPDLLDLCESVVGTSSPVEAAERLVEAWGGGTVYVPALRDLRRAHLVRRVAELYDASANGGRGNAASVARRLGLSRRTVAGMLRE